MRKAGTQTAKKSEGPLCFWFGTRVRERIKGGLRALGQWAGEAAVQAATTWTSWWKGAAGPQLRLLKLRK